MLQADEIIQQKEWQQLSAEEKNIVAELAGNEGEYNLLKKMLMVSAEALAEVPELNPAIQERVRKELPVVKKTSFNKYWFAAAAAIVVTAIAAIFIIQKENNPGIVNAPEIKTTTNPAVLKKDSLPVKDSTATLAKKEIIKAPARQLPVQKPVFPALQDSAQNNYVMLDASVGNDPSLLDLVTEVE